MKIEIKNLTKAQELAIETMLSTWKYLGDIGSSRYVALFVDGDGNFRPEITIEGKKPEAFKFKNGREYPTEKGNTYYIDFDVIAWEIEE